MAEEKVRTEQEPADQPGGADSETPGGADPDYVRPAGPKEMQMPLRRWTKTDEEIDESFPASDPPGNY
jgi:hypothetical protein